MRNISKRFKPMGFLWRSKKFAPIEILIRGLPGLPRFFVFQMTRNIENARRGLLIAFPIRKFGLLWATFCKKILWHPGSRDFSFASHQGLPQRKLLLLSKNIFHSCFKKAAAARRLFFNSCLSDLINKRHVHGNIARTGFNTGSRRSSPFAIISFSH